MLGKRKGRKDSGKGVSLEYEYEHEVEKAAPKKEVVKGMKRRAVEKVDFWHQMLLSN